ncbi:MAG: anion permease [Candidatus Lokiarchaeota archaeon]|nr:anion permease [Candidatus Lokiarchaeota archaeon]
MDPVVILTIFMVISILIAIAIGANDESFASIYGSRILNMKQILILATIFAILGALLLGEGVAKSVGGDILLTDNFAASVDQNAVVLTILISTTIWLIVASALGLPISTTHATIGSIMGLGLLLGGGNGVDWNTILGMSMWWLLSPVVGFVVTYLVVKILNRHKVKHLNGFQDFERSENRYALIILVVIFITAFSRAGNDCSNAVGIVFGVEGDLNLTALLALTGVGLALGIIVLGRIVIRSLGRMTELRPSTAFAAQLPTAAVMLIGTIQKIPLSGSHMLVASLVGLSKASNAPMKKGLWKIVAIWLLTFPMSAILAIILYFPISAGF